MATPISDGINATFDALDSIILRKKQEAAKKSKEESQKLQEEAIQDITDTQSEQNAKASGAGASAEPINTAAAAVTQTVGKIVELKETLGSIKSIDDAIGMVNNIITFATEGVVNFATSVLQFVNALVKLPADVVTDAGMAPGLVTQRGAQSMELATTDWPSVEDTPKQVDAEPENI